MKIRYFADTETLPIEFGQTAVANTRENMVADVGAHRDAYRRPTQYGWLNGNNSLK